MKCLICNNMMDEIRHPKFVSIYHACPACGFISKDPQCYDTPEEEFAVYETHENSIDDPRYVAFFETFLHSAVFPFMNGEKNAFDFGSGPSPVLAQLMERDYGYRYSIYDKFYAPHKNYVGKKFDLITSTEVMEHIADPILIFKELKDLLKEDGILAIMTLFLPKSYDQFFGWHYMRDTTHVSFYTPKAMSIIADRVGLELIYCDDYRYTTFKRKTEIV